MPDLPTPAVAIQPRSADWIDAAVLAGGARLVEPAEATAMVWTSSSAPDELAATVAAHPDLGWIQLPWAGIEPYLDVLDASITYDNLDEAVVGTDIVVAASARRGLSGIQVVSQVAAELGHFRQRPDGGFFRRAGRARGEDDFASVGECGRVHD